MAFPDREVERLLVATGRECCICHVRHAVSVHHIVLAADGGTDDIDNAIPLCPNCHDQVHASAALGRTTRKYTPGELRSFREAQIEATRDRRGTATAHGLGRTAMHSPDGPQTEAAERTDPVPGMAANGGGVAEPVVQADEGLPDYRMDLGRMEERICDLRERADVLRQVGLSQAAEPLSDEIAQLTKWLPLVEAGYPLMDDFGWQLTREACGLSEYSIDLASDPGEVPDSVLRTWHDVRRSRLFDDLEMWGYGEPWDDDTPFAHIGGYVVGVTRGRRFWVTGW